MRTPTKKKPESRLKRMQPVNLPMALEDGRLCLVRKQVGSLLECRQKGTGLPLMTGDIVTSVAHANRQRAQFEVTKRTRKNVTMRFVKYVGAEK